MDTATLERSPADAARWHCNQASCLAALIGEDEEALVRHTAAAGPDSTFLAGLLRSDGVFPFYRGAGSCDDPSVTPEGSIRNRKPGVQNEENR